MTIAISGCGGGGGGDESGGVCQVTCTGGSVGSGPSYTAYTSYSGVSRDWCIDKKVNSSCKVTFDGETLGSYSYYYIDADSDGYGNLNNSQISISQPTGWVSNGRDCNDSNANINPDATEISDGIDNNCNFKIDDVTYYQDADNDSYGDRYTSQIATTQPSGWVTNRSDCNDSDAAINPDATEIADGVDNNCNLQIDEGFYTFYQDVDSDGYGNILISQVSTTQPTGWVRLFTDCNDADNAIHPGAIEIANGFDSNCNGVIDDVTYYQDADNDSYGDRYTSQITTTQPEGWVTNSSDCNDTDTFINPGAIEIFDSIDNNCNTQIDEGFFPYYQDTDSDNYGNPAISQIATIPPTGYVLDNSDCDDTSAAINPGATEIADGIDNNCDGVIVNFPNPLGVLATPSDSQITLSWSPVDGSTSYTIYWNTTAGVTKADNKISNATSPYVHMNLTNGKTYYYAIIALNQASESKLSNEVNAVPSTLISNMIFADSNLQACVDSLGREWSYEITSLSCNDKNISDISGLSILTNLTYLSLSNNNITDISSLSSLTGLTTLLLNGNSISDVDPLASLSNLTAMWMQENSISDIRALSSLTGLTRLYLYSNSITNVDPLASLTNLTSLWLQSNNVSNINTLGGLIKLTQLMLGSNNISDISVLTSLRSLNYLSLQANFYISDISALMSLTGLTNLYLAGTTISDINVLTSLSNLSSLSLSNINDLSAISSLSNLSDLTIYNSNIGDMSVLLPLTNLTSLRLSHNGIGDVSPLANLAGLTELYLDNNTINTGVATLISLLNATVIDLSNNDNIPCTELTTLVTALGSVVIQPASCI